MVHQLLDEIVGPTTRRFVALPFLNQDRQGDDSVLEEIQQRLEILVMAEGSL